MRSYYSYRALAALDEHCGDYIEQAAGWRFQRQVWAELPAQVRRQRRFRCPGGRCSWSFQQCGHWQPGIRSGASAYGQCGEV